MFVKPPNTITAENLYLKLKENKILVRYFSKPERISSFIRITISKENDMDILLSTLKKIIQ